MTQDDSALSAAKPGLLMESESFFILFCFLFIAWDENSEGSVYLLDLSLCIILIMGRSTVSVIMLDIFQTGVTYKLVKVVHGNLSDNYCNQSYTWSSVLLLLVLSSTSTTVLANILLPSHLEHTHK